MQQKMAISILFENSILNSRVCLKVLSGHLKRSIREQLREKSKEELDKSQTIPSYSQKAGRPLLLGELNEMVWKYLLTLSKRGGVINTTVANATAKALMSKYPHVVRQIDVDSSRWAKSLFSRMNFVKRRKTSSKVDIPDGTRKEIEFCIYCRETQDTSSTDHQH